MATQTVEIDNASRDEKILELERQGKSRRAIAAELGIGKSTVDHIIKTHELTQNQPYQLVPLEQIAENPWQPRSTRTIQEEMVTPEVAELADNIKELGLLQYPVGRKIRPDLYELAFGHRRIAALRLLAQRGEWDGGAPLIVQNLSDKQMALTALSENRERKQLSPIEELRAYEHDLATIDDLNIAELARTIGVDRSTLSNNLRILKLPQLVLERVESGEMNLHAAREFLCLMNVNHAHEEDMKYVIDFIDDTPQWPGTADWRAKNVRKVIRRRVVQYSQYWRPLEPHNGDLDHYSDYSPSNGSQPNFDPKEIPETHVHHIPRLDDKSRKWTCDVKLWQRLDQKARDSQRVAQESVDVVKPTGTSVGEPIATLQSAIAAAQPGIDESDIYGPSGEGSDGPVEQPNIQQLLDRQESWVVTVREMMIIYTAVEYAMGNPNLSQQSRDVLEDVIDLFDQVFKQVGVDPETFADMDEG